VRDVEVPFFVVNAFTDRAFMGNPAGVVPDATPLDEEQMQLLAAELKCSETAFVLPSSRAHYRIRFFTPLREVDLCGHATVAAFSVLRRQGSVSQGQVTMETGAGVLPIHIRGEQVFMEQAAPRFKEAPVAPEEVAQALRISPHEMDRHPLESVSTGLWSLPVPVARRRTLENMRPDFDAVAEVCRRCEVGALFVFTLDTLYPDCLVHARCFAPLYGVQEDPVTGTANGALGAYLHRHGLLERNPYTAEQGYEMGRGGLVTVEVAPEKVRVGGGAYVARQGTLYL